MANFLWFFKANSPVSIGFWLPFKKDPTEEKMHTHTQNGHKLRGRVFEGKNTSEIGLFLRQRFFLIF